jgi:pimeloyl-ACP methyl ester carboxylesterase
MRITFTIVALALAAPLVGCHSSVRSSDGTKIVYDAVGEGEPALVFIHGWCCNRRQWENQVPEFAQDHCAVAIDLAGHGDSGDSRTAWTIPATARDVEAVLEHLDLHNVILVGHSMGGPVALMVAKAMPDRVIGVIGVDTLHDAEFEFPPEMIEQFAAAFEDDFEGAVRGFFGSMYPEEAELNRNELDRLIRDALANDPQMAADLMRGFGDLDSSALFAECPVPIYCINAAQPNPTYAERNRKHNPRFNVVLMENVSHWPHLERPAEFNAMLRKAIEKVKTESADAG